MRLRERGTRTAALASQVDMAAKWLWRPYGRASEHPDDYLTNKPDLRTQGPDSGVKATTKMSSDGVKSGARRPKASHPYPKLPDGSAGLTAAAGVPCDASVNDNVMRPLSGECMAPEDKPGSYHVPPRSVPFLSSWSTTSVAT